MKAPLHEFARRIFAGRYGSQLIGLINETQPLTKITTVLLMTALLLPLILVGTRQATFAAAKNPAVADTSTASSAPAFVSESAAPMFDTTLSIILAVNQSAVSGYQAVAAFLVTAPPPEGFAPAKMPTAWDKISGSISSFIAPLSFIYPNAEAPAAVAAPMTALGTTKFDFTGDGQADVSRWQTAGEWKIKSSANGSFSTDSLPGAGTAAAPADYDGDGITDRAVFTDYAGQWKITYSSTNTTQTINYFGQAGDKVVSGNYSGNPNGKADLAVWRPANGTWYVLQLSTGTVTSRQWGQAGDVPVPGNYDGDDKLDYVVYRPSNGTWYQLLSSSGYSYTSAQWGASSDTPVPADYDGDGKTDLAVYRPSNGTWYVSRSDGSPYISKIWGNYGDQPVPADYDGDGRADFAVWRPTTGVWYLVRSSDQTFSTYTYHQLGVTGDVAVPSAYLKQTGGQVLTYDLANARLAPGNATGGTDLYSQNFSWGTGLVNLPGRAGLDAGLGISYNSLVWTKETTSNVMVFDADHANISPGFNFGFPTIEPGYYNALKQKFSYLMVTPSGGRVEFRQNAASNIYDATDSSYAQLKVNTPTGGGPQVPTENVTMTVTTTDGTRMDYDWKAGAYRLYRITDRNGNYISVTYDADYGLLLKVTDTLGREITVDYDGDFSPTTIKQQWKAGNGGGAAVTHTYATFTYTAPPISPNFKDAGGTDIGVYGPSGGVNVKLLNNISYADGSTTAFKYNAYGQVYEVSQKAADYHELSRVRTDLETVSGAQPDCPRFTKTWTKVENFNGNAETEVRNSPPAAGTFTAGGESIGNLTFVEAYMVGAPHDVKSKQWYYPTGNWAAGLPLGTEDFADGARQRWTRTVWTQDDPTKTYIINPRVIESKVGDAANTKRTTIDYLLEPERSTSPGEILVIGEGGDTVSGGGAEPNANISKFSLVSEVKVYDTNQTTVLKRATTDYNLTTAYLSRRIIGLPSKRELYDGTGNLLSKMTYSYDGGDFTGAGQNIPAVIQHDTANYGAGFIIGRGNTTQMTRCDVQISSAATCGGGISSQIRYNTAGAAVAQVNPLGKTVGIGYADNFNDGGNYNTYAYPTTLTDPDNYSSQIQYRFDMGANVWAKSPDPNAVTGGKTTVREFDAVGRLTKQKFVTAGNTGAYTRYEYPADQKQSKTYTTVTDTNDNSIADAADEVLTESFYDGAGRTIKSRTPLTFTSSGSTATWVGRQTVYDMLGRASSQSVPTEIDAAWTPTGDDAAGWKWTSQEYDWKGRVTHEIGLDNVDKYYSYDGCGCAGGEVTTIQGELVARDDQTGTARRTQKIYADILGRTAKTEVLNWDGNIYSTVVNEFNGRDQMTKSRRYEGAAGSLIFQEATMDYDGHGRLKTSRAPEQANGKETAYTYYADDRPQMMTDGRGASSLYTYNNRGLVSRIDYSLPGAANNFPTLNPNTNAPTSCTPEISDFPNCGGSGGGGGGGGGGTPPGPYLSSVTFAYDNAGSRINMTDSATGTTTYDYDQLSRMIAEHRQLKSSWNIPTHNFDISYTYNLIGQLKSVTDPFGQKIDYATDKAGKLEQITGTPFGAANQSVTSYVNDIKYRAFGAVKEMDYGNGVQMTQKFDNRLQLEEFKVENPGGGTPSIKKNYQYYNDGRMKFSSDTGDALLRGDSHNFDRSYAYDFMGRLTAARSGIEAGGTPASDRSQVPYKQDYTYNAFGNVTARNTYHWTQSDDQTNAWTNNKENSWTYDEDGRLKATPGNKYYYDAAGGLVMTTLSDSRRTIQHLDGDGRAVRQDQYLYYSSQYNLQQSVYYIYSTVLGKLLTEVTSGATKKRTFVYGTGGAVVALQQYNGTGAGTYQEVRWEHTDPGNASYVQTAYNGVKYNDSSAELDPLGSNAGLNNPYGQPQPNSPQNAGAGGWGYGSFGDPFGGYNCRLDGFEMPCSTVLYTVSVGAGSIDFNHSDQWTLGNLGIVRGNGISNCAVSDELCRIVEQHVGYSNYETILTHGLFGPQTRLNNDELDNQNPCERMAERANQIVSEIYHSQIGSNDKGMIDFYQALGEFDRQFSLYYVGLQVKSFDDLKKFLGAATSKSRESLGFSTKSEGPNPIASNSELGQYDFKDQYRDSRDKYDAADQTHHFVAFLSAGINMSASTDFFSWMHELDDRYQGNTGDVALGTAAYNYGVALKKDPGRNLGGIKNWIRTNICK